MRLHMSTIVTIFQLRQLKTFYEHNTITPERKGKGKVNTGGLPLDQSPLVTYIITLTVSSRYFQPGLQLPSQPYSDITNPSSCLHHLLSGPREQYLTSQLRTFEKYPRTYTHTRRYCSFINHALNNYQDKMTNPQTLGYPYHMFFLLFSPQQFTCYQSTCTCDLLSAAPVTHCCFYPRDAQRQRVIVIASCPSGCLSGCLSQPGLYENGNSQHHDFFTI